MKTSEMMATYERIRYRRGERRRIAMGSRRSLLLLLIVGCGGPVPPYQGKSAAELERMLRDVNPTVQTEGAIGLARLGPQGRDAAPALIEALTGPHPLVR